MTNINRVGNEEVHRRVGKEGELASRGDQSFNVLGTLKEWTSSAYGRKI